MLLERSPRLGGALRTRILDLLCSRPEWAGQLLDAVRQGTIAPKDLRASHVVQIARHRDADLTRRIEALWGRSGLIGQFTLRIALPKAKRVLADTVVGRGESWLSELSTEDLRDLVRLEAAS